MTRKKLYSGGALVLAAALFLVLNLAGRPLLRSARLDLTQNHLYTLSQGTKNILKGLKHPVTLRLFWSRQVAQNTPGLQRYAQQVQDLLAEYADLSGGQLRVQTIDPEPFSAAEDDAVRYGLQGAPVGDDNLYFGLVGQAGATTQTIPFFQQDRERFLEYDLTQLVYNLVQPQKPVVGLLSALPLTGGVNPANPFARSQPWMIVDQLRRQFQVDSLDPNLASVPADVKVLMVVQPEKLSANALYAVDQFVLGGGKALVFADPLPESSQAGGPQALLQQTPEANRLLAAWGVRLAPGKVVGDRQLAQRVSFGGEGGRPQIVSYLPWLAVPADRFNADEVTTAQLGQLNLATAGALEPVEHATTRLVPLIRSTDDAALLDATKTAFSPNPKGMLATFKPAGGPFVLAARIEGPARTAFPDGPPPLPKKPGQKDAKAAAKDPRPAQIKDAKAPINVIVVADSDLLQDRFWVRTQNFFGRRIAIPVASNADLVANALDQLGGSADLISVRSRGSYARPFTLVKRIRRQAEGHFLAKEEALQQQLKQTEGKLAELQKGRKDAASPNLTPAQQQEVEKFRQQKVETRKELRAVQYQLRANIDQLETMLKLFNIAFVPGILALVAFISWVVRRSRERGWQG